MSTATLLNKYVWLVTTVFNRGPISLDELCRRWNIHFGSEDELTERTFHRYTDAVEELFDIDIKYNRTLRGYVIDNREDIDNMAMRKWLIHTFSVNSLLGESQDLKRRVLLEEVPSGQIFLTPIIEAMRESKLLLMTYRSFHQSAESTFEVEPWCLKLFERRWYMLGKSKGCEEPRIYALDRVKKLEVTNSAFKLPKKFDAERLFADCYGIIIGEKDCVVESIAIRVDACQCDYLRSLPLHHSQVEVECNDEYSIFEYRLRPSFDFRQKLLSMGGSICILAPLKLRDTMRNEGDAIAQSNTSQEIEYKFRLYRF